MCTPSVPEIDKPKPKTNTTSFKDEVQSQLKTSIPTTLCFLLFRFPWLISLYFVGNIGSEEFAAAALASSLCDVTGMSFAVGLSSAITTLTGQARGEMIKLRNRSVAVDKYGSIPKTQAPDNNIPSPLLYLYRGIFIQLVFVIPVGLYWIHGISPLLISLGQKPTLSSMTADYLCILAPGLWFNSINLTLNSWLQSLEMADVPAYAAVVGVMSHIPFNLWFIHGLGWGYKGVAAATVMFQVIQPLLVCCYLFIIPSGKARLDQECNLSPQHHQPLLSSLHRAIFCYKGILQYLALALPGVVLISEWWASNVAIFLAGRLSPAPDIALDGMTIYQSINSFCFMFPIGASVGGSTRVGNCLGMGRFLEARTACHVSVLYAGCWSFALGMVLYFVPHTLIPSFFSPDVGVQEETAKVIPLLAFYVFADGVQVAFTGVIKGCGRQCITMPIVLTAYWVVGVPLAYYFAFVENNGQMYVCGNYFCGIKGLVSGLTIGTWVHMILLGVTVLCATDWELEAKNSRQRLMLEQESVPAESFSRETTGSWMSESEHLLENVT